MKFKDFINAYQSLSVLQKLDVPTPAVVTESYHDAILRLGVRGESPNVKAIASWDEIVDYQIFQLKLYLRNFWKNMLDDDAEDVDAFLSFLRLHKELYLFMGKELLFFLSEVDKRCKLFYLTEDILQTDVVKNFLVYHRYDEDVKNVFQKMMLLKIQYVDASSAYCINYRIFMNWLPSWKDIYPNVWNAVVQDLSEMKESADHEALEMQKLYKLYGLV